MITDRRNCLKEDVVEAVECMKSWSMEYGTYHSFKCSEEEVRIYHVTRVGI